MKPNRMKYCLKFKNHTFPPIVIRQKFRFQTSFLFAKFFSVKILSGFLSADKILPFWIFFSQNFLSSRKFHGVQIMKFSADFTGWPSFSWLSRCCTDNLEMFRLVPALVLATALSKISSLFSQKLRYGMDFKTVEVNFTELQ